MTDTRLKFVVPGDNPPQIQGSPHLDRLEPYGDVHLYLDRPSSMEEQLERARDAHVIINTRGAVKWPAEALRALPSLRMIATCSIGVDMIDIEVARERGIVVSNQPGRTAPVVAEHVIGLMFAAAKRAAFQTIELKAGRWTLMQNMMLQGKTIGIVGTGNVGREVARIANALGMSCLAWTYNPSPERAENMGVEFVELDHLLKESDVVSLHVRLSPDSHHIIGARELALMKSGALLINGGRGELVDDTALVEALQLGTPRRRGPRRLRPGTPPARSSHPGLRSGRPHAPPRRPDPRGHRAPQRRRRHQRHRLPRRPPQQRRRVKRRYTPSSIPR